MIGLGHTANVATFGIYKICPLSFNSVGVTACLIDREVERLSPGKSIVVFFAFFMYLFWGVWLSVFGE